jgi:hypothetical protein
VRILVIDDLRTFSEATSHARTFADGVTALVSEKWDKLYLDHDLGETKTGYDVMCWLEINPKCLPREIILVTSNPVGRQRMQMVIDKLYGGNT